jgi:hypothetical protein
MADPGRARPPADAPDMLASGRRSRRPHGALSQRWTSSASSISHGIGGAAWPTSRSGGSNGPLTRPPRGATVWPTAPSAPVRTSRRA